MVDTAPVLASAQLTQCRCLSSQTGVHAVGDGISLATGVHIDSAFRDDTWHRHGCSLDLRPSWQDERVPEVSCLGYRCAVEMHVPRRVFFTSFRSRLTNRQVHLLENENKPCLVSLSYKEGPHL